MQLLSLEASFGDTPWPPHPLPACQEEPIPGSKQPRCPAEGEPPCLEEATSGTGRAAGTPPCRLLFLLSSNSFKQANTPSSKSRLFGSRAVALPNERSPSLARHRIPGCTPCSPPPWLPLCPGLGVAWELLGGAVLAQPSLPALASATLLAPWLRPVARASDMESGSSSLG